MKHTLYAIFSCLCLLVSFDAKAQYGEVRGYVLCYDIEDGIVRVKNAKISVYKDGVLTERSAKTDVCGIYIIKALEPGDYTVVASHPVYGRDSSEITITTAAITEANLGFSNQYGCLKSPTYYPIHASAAHPSFTNQSMLLIQQLLPCLNRNSKHIFRRHKRA